MARIVIGSYSYNCVVWLDRDFGDKKIEVSGIMLLSELKNGCICSDNVIRAKIMLRILIKYPDVIESTEIEFKEVRIKEY